MSPYKNIIVALDLTDHDVYLLRYMEYIQRAFLADKITFLYISPQLPKILESFYPFPARGGSLKEIEEKLKYRVSVHFDTKQQTKVVYKVLHGMPLTEIYEYARRENADLVVMGTKPKKEGSGIVTRRIARKVPCSVLLVPGMKKYRTERILIPFDFSRHAMESIDLSIHIRHLLDDPALKAVYILDNIPGVSGTEWDDKKKHIIPNIKESFEEYWAGLKKGAIDIEFHVLERKKRETGKQLYDYAKKAKADLIFIGAKGHSNLEILAIGSVAEKIIEQNRKIPMLIVRDIAGRPAGGVKIHAEADQLG